MQVHHHPGNWADPDTFDPVRPSLLPHSPFSLALCSCSLAQHDACVDDVGRNIAAGSMGSAAC